MLHIVQIKFTFSITVAFLTLLNFAIPIGGVEDYRKVHLDAHNEYRFKHDAPPLTLNETLNQKAEECAKHYISKGDIDLHDCPFRFTGLHQELGENLHEDWADIEPNFVKNAREAVHDWYDGVKLFDFIADAGNPPETASFSQLVWRETNEIGVGIAVGIANVSLSNNSKVVVATLYYPKGNMATEYKNNVLVAANSSFSLIKNSCVVLQIIMLLYIWTL